MDYETRTVGLPRGAEGSTNVFRSTRRKSEIVDEAAGEFIEVSQTGRTDLGKIAINPEEWPTLRERLLTDGEAMTLPTT